METIVENLKGNPIFNMSLASKELFHSNFLEFLWNVNHTAFIEMFNSFLPEDKHLKNREDYYLKREKDNFDICLYHDNQHYDLIIENKVKSIPYKEQLQSYEERAKNSSGCLFILLTLSDDFPDKNDVGNWHIVEYSRLCQAIIECYQNCGERLNRYITDYCDFIEQLVALKEIIIPKDFRNSKVPLFKECDINTLKSIRMHDLYIKLRSSIFALSLKKELESRGINVAVIHKYSERKMMADKKIVNLNVSINQGVGQIAVWICDKNTNTFEIVIQGKQYRHGINRLSSTPPEEKKYELLNDCYNKLVENTDKRAKLFLDFDGTTDVLPSSENGEKYHFKKSNTPKSGPFCCYGHSYIYRYKDCGDILVNDLMDKMVQDVVRICSDLPDL